MTVLEVVLLLIGFLLIGISFFLSEKKESPVEDEQRHYEPKELWSDKDEEIVKRRIDDILQEKMHDIVSEATEHMGHISNEKIIAVDEYSNQILEKIDQNHKEVVFMYNMLSEKEKKLKLASQEIPSELAFITESEKQKDILAKDESEKIFKQENEWVKMCIRDRSYRY